jgi:hypothetical protein
MTSRFVKPYQKIIGRQAYMAWLGQWVAGISVRRTTTIARDVASNRKLWRKIGANSPTTGRSTAVQVAAGHPIDKASRGDFKLVHKFYSSASAVPLYAANRRYPAESRAGDRNRLVMPMRHDMNSSYRRCLGVRSGDLARAGQHSGEQRSAGRQ